MYRRLCFSDNLNLTIECLKSKPCVYSKADKGNAMVIVNTSDYENGMLELLEDGPYTEVRDPSGKMATLTSKILNKHINVLSKETKWRLLVSNPIIPRLYGLPKIHKPGNKWRPILSNINAATEKSQKWLVEEFRRLTPPFSLTVKNSIEFVHKIENETILPDEIMVSFDVTSLFPNVPMEKVYPVLEEWLKQQNVPDEKIEMYMDLTKLGMDNSYLQFRGKFYRQTHGTAMGVALAPFLSSDLFLGSFEKEIVDEDWFPRIWHRYVDDVFAVIKKSQLENIIEKLNQKYAKIQFTHEIELDNKLPFLDITVIRNGNIFEFDIFRKTTSTDRFITSDSFHCVQQKSAAFNSMCYRMYNIPLTSERFSQEKENILRIAKINGYTSEFITRIFNKYERKRKLRSVTSLQVIKEPKKRVKLTYFPKLSNKLSNLFKSKNCDIITSSQYQIKSFLFNNKDKVNSLHKSGI